jgi:hypothetical protein
MLNMAIPVPDLDMISTEPSNALGSSMCSLLLLLLFQIQNLISLHLTKKLIKKDFYIYMYSC